MGDPRPELLRHLPPLGQPDADVLNRFFEKLALAVSIPDIYVFL